LKSTIEFLGGNRKTMLLPEGLSSLDQRHAVAENFADQMSDGGAPLSSEAARALQLGSSMPIYGEPFAHCLDQLSSTEDVDPRLVAAAAVVLFNTMQHSDGMYTHARPGIRTNPKFVSELKALQHSMVARKGMLPLSPEFAMAVEEGKEQVAFAGIVMGVAEAARPGVQRVLSDVNYERFWNNTRIMGTGVQISDVTIEQALTEDVGNQLSHVTLGNLGVSEEVMYLVNNYPGLIRIIDGGAGSGATTGAVISRFHEAPGGVDLSRISITVIEGNRGYVDGGLQELGKAAVAKMQETGNDLQLQIRPDQDDAYQPGTLSLVHGELGQTIAQLEGVHDGLTIVMLNYVPHRLPDSVKVAVAQKIRQVSRESEFVFGGLSNNTSYGPNRRCLNFWPDGPLNVGMEHIRPIFEASRYRVHEIAREGVPPSLTPRLGERLAAGATDDAHFIIARSIHR
jgi:hypothetical protein